MTGLSIIISLGLAVLYTEDPVPPNLAERQRTEVDLKILKTTSSDVLVSKIFERQ